MIFWFSGTGNSLHAANFIAARNGDRLKSIAEAVRERRFQYKLDEQETLGLVMPVYFWGIPRIAGYFLEQLQIENQPRPYTWLVLTCGGSACNAASLVRRYLPLDYYRELVMPDNYIVMYDVRHPDDNKQKLLQADQKLTEISRLIRHRYIPEKEETPGPLALLQTRLLYPFYVRGRKTDKFAADEKCDGCGLCVKVCPVSAIELQQQRPRWKSESCELCLGCINRCPKQAIQYGKGTAKRGRYLHPDFAPPTPAAAPAHSSPLQQPAPRDGE
ncbi:MAG: EFR1 family ferrodoxin [Bacillota bacterium]|nr:EFR1 family ferrodoxin [Bacillota bacterium]